MKKQNPKAGVDARPPRVMWDDDDRKIVLRQGIKERAADPEAPISAIIERAQRALAPARRRPRAEPYKVRDWFNEETLKSVEPKAVQPKAVEPKPEPKPEPVLVAEPEPVALPVTEFFQAVEAQPVARPVEQEKEEQPAATQQWTPAARALAAERIMKVREAYIASGKSWGLRKDGTAKVRWSFKGEDSEQDQVAEEAARLVLTGFPQKPVLPLMREAQKVLPPARHKETMNGKDWFMPLFEKKLAKLRRAEERKSADLVRLEEESRRLDAEIQEQQQREQSEAMREDVQHVEAVSLDLAPAVGRITEAPGATKLAGLFGQLRQAFVEEIAAIFEDGLQLAIRRNIQAYGDAVASGLDRATLGDLHEPPTPKAEHMRRPADAIRHKPYIVNGTPRATQKKVLVVGLTNKQKQMMELDFGHLLDMRYYLYGENNGAALKQKAKACDVALCYLAAPVSHSESQSTEANAPVTHLIRGGLGEVRQRLVEQLAPEVQAQLELDALAKLSKQGGATTVSAH